MKTTLLRALAIAVVLSPAVVFTQAGKSKPTTATYITKEEVDTVNKNGQGIDRNIKVVDIGHENYTVGIIHRGVTKNGVAVPAAGAAPAAAAAGRAGGAAAAPAPTPCGRTDGDCACRRNRRRHHARLADRGLLHCLGRRHDVHRRLHRQRTAQSVAGSEWADVRRQCVQRREEKREAGRHHHRPGGRGARLARHPRARGLSELPSVAGDSNGGLGSPGAQEIGNLQPRRSTQKPQKPQRAHWLCVFSEFCVECRSVVLSAFQIPSSGIRARIGGRRPASHRPRE